MSIVTVQGAANNSTISLSYDNDANAQLASYIAGAIQTGLTNGTIQAADSSAGPPPPVPPGVTGEFVQSTRGVTALPPGYGYVVDSARNAVIFGSGGAGETPPPVGKAPSQEGNVSGSGVAGGGENILVGSGNLTFYAAAGESLGHRDPTAPAPAIGGTVIGGGGNNLISIPFSDSGGWNIALGNGNNTIRALGGGDDTMSLGTGHNVIQLGTGSSSITSAGSDTVLASSGSETIVATGSDVIYGNGSQLLFVGTGGGGATIYGGSGSETAYGGSGRDLMFGGSAGNNFLQAGSGRATLFGGGNGDQLYAGGGAAQALHATGGNETLFGGFASGNDTFYGGSGKDQITTSIGNSTVVAGGGAATVGAVASKTVFDFIKGQAGGTELVQDLTDASQVHITLTGYASNEATKALAGQSTNGISATIKLSDNTTVTFQNITHLTSGNFS